MAAADDDGLLITVSLNPNSYVTSSWTNYPTLSAKKDTAFRVKCVIEYLRKYWELAFDE